MVQFTDAKDVILALKKAYKEKNLSIDKVLAMVNNQFGEGTISRSTIQAVFAEGSENGARQFGFTSVLKPLCVVLLDIEQIEENDSADVKAYKQIMLLKKELIEELKAANERIKLEYAEKLQDETDRYLKSMEFKDHQIELKDRRIDALLRMNDYLSTTNNKLINQLMDCPLREKQDEKIS